jgi:hypothetical protein
VWSRSGLTLDGLPLTSSELMKRLLPLFLLWELCHADCCRDAVSSRSGLTSYGLPLALSELMKRLLPLFLQQKSCRADRCCPLGAAVRHFLILLWIHGPCCCFAPSASLELTRSLAQCRILVLQPAPHPRGRLVRLWCLQVFHRTQRRDLARLTAHHFHQ